MNDMPTFQHPIQLATLKVHTALMKLLGKMFLPIRNLLDSVNGTSAFSNPTALSELDALAAEKRKNAEKLWADGK